MKRSFFVLVGLIAVLLAGMVFPSAADTTFNLLENASFDEVDLYGPIKPWKVANADGDKSKCVKARAGMPQPHSPSCMFMFTGGPDATSIRQTLGTKPLGDMNDLLACGELHFFPTFYMYPATNRQNVITMTVTIKYVEDGTRYESRMVEPIRTPEAGMWSQVGFGELALPAGVHVQQISFQIRHTGSKGKVYIDDVALDASDTFRGAGC